MTEEEAKSCIRTIELLRRLAFNVHGVMDVIDAGNCDKIIAMLSQEPCEDLISRQAAIDRIRNMEEWRTGDAFNADRVIRHIKDLPPVNPQRTGHWRHYEGMLICSACRAEFYDDIMEYCGDDVPKCCPDCGARMQEVQE